MAQDNTPPSSQLSRCGQPLPLPANFDCVAYTQIPPSIPPLPNMTLREKNKANTAFEKRNEESVAMTRSFERARASSAGVGSVDVGPPLVALYEYSDSDIELMASSKELVDAVGPLPISVTLKLAEIRLKIVKDTSEKSRREKEKSPVSTIGTLVMQNPVEYSSVLSEDVHIPNIFLETVNQKLWLPLHWWMDAILRDADRDPQSVPSTTCTPSQTSPTTKPVKVQVIDFEKMITKHGGLDYGTTLTPSKWRQCARNLLKAVTQLCSSDPTAITPATELSKHLKFFTLNKWFDDEFHVWYPLEYELRGKVLHNTLYNETARRGATSDITSRSTFR
ncbi:hypothetical protein R3P38DRAFT_2772341 [Favolaschia claudopus]|uniref:Uncharacterized protein n=1 Tax=Favolaschia claudopus TaxID=2862362 RepID=A0AAW0C5S0_9AGAR